MTTDLYSSALPDLGVIDGMDEEICWDDKLNLVGHCVLCLNTVSSTGLAQEEESMDHLWPYLSENWKKEYAAKLTFLLSKGQNQSGFGELYESRVPPLCDLCQDSVKILDKLHHDMVRIRNQIETQAGAIRRMMEQGEFEKGFLRFARDVKNAKVPLMCVSNTIKFLSRLHHKSSRELQKLLSSVRLADKDETGKDLGESSMSGSLEALLETDLLPSLGFSPYTPGGSASSPGDHRDDFDDDPAAAGDDRPPTTPHIKIEPEDRSDQGEDDEMMMPDVNDYLDSNNYIPAKKHDKDKVPTTTPRRGRGRPPKACPKSVKEKLSAKRKGRPGPKSRKRRRKISETNSEESEEEKIIPKRSTRIKREIQSDLEEPDEDSRANDDNDSDWIEEPSPARGKGRQSKPRVASEFKYKTHSRKKCEVCMEKLPLNVLFEHLKTHVKDYACKCPNCGQSFMSKHRLEVYHYQKWPKCRMAAGLPPPPWTKKCESCDFASDTPATLRSHLQKHEIPTERNFTCPFINCGESFTLRQNVEFHLERHYNQGSSSAASQRCPICAKCIEYNATVDMQSHLKRNHKLQEVFPCTTCPHVYHNREALIKHIFPKHQKEGVRCDICTGDETKYFKENQLREHYFTAHTIGTRQTCDLCDYIGYGPKQLQKHRWYKHKNGEAATPLKTFRCEICTDKVIEYKSKDALTSHNIRFHGASPFVCKICGETFETKNRWWRHERLHNGPIAPRYKCEYCGKQFDIANKLKDHVNRVHLKAFVNTFKCDECDKSYSDICGLRYHKSSVHLGIKYVCDECGESFAAPGALKSHQRRHTGERPYKCHLCPNSFRQPDAYKRHLFCHETLGDKFKPKKTSDRKFRTDNNKEGDASEAKLPTAEVKDVGSSEVKTISQESATATQ